MAGVNKVIVVGNLGRDPEVRYSQAGMAICSMSVAVTERVKDGDNGWKDRTEWFRLKAFGKTAENAGQYLQKGRQVYVEGRLETSKYKDKEGVERTGVEVIVQVLQYLASGNGQRRGEAGEGGGGAPGDEPPAADGFIDDDLPF